MPKKKKSQIFTYTPEEIITQIKGKKDLLKKMVGSLYPIILQDQITELRIKYKEATGNTCPA